jgi:hypothetical protein
MTEQRDALRGQTAPGHELEPVLVETGEYALPRRVLDDPFHAAKFDDLNVLPWSYLAFDRYLNTVSGNNGNTGLSRAQAKATVAGLGTITAGMFVGVARDSDFASADWNLSAVDDVTLASYGFGKLPIFDGRLIYAGAWQTSVDRGDAHTSVYSVDVEQTLTEGYISVWRDGAKPAWLASRSLADCQATPNSFFIPDDATSSNKTSAGTHTIYAHFAGSANPNTDGAVYKITDAKIPGAVKLGLNSVACQIHTRCQMQADGSFTAGFGSLAERCLFSDGVKHEALMNSGEYRESFGWHPHADVRTDNIVLEFYASDGSGRSIKYSGCAARGPNNNYSQSINAFGGHNQGPGTIFESFEVIDSSVEDVRTALAVSAENVGSITRLYGRHVDTLSSASLVNPTSRVPALDCRIHAVRNRSDVRVITSISPYDVEGLRCFIKDRVDAIFFQAAGWTLTKSCIVVSALSSSSFFADNESGGTLMQWSDTIIVYEDAGAEVLRLTNWTTPGAGVLGTRSNNVYFCATASLLRATVAGVSYNSPTLFLAAFPETGSILTNPLVEDAENGLWSASGVTNSAGLERPDIEYTYVPTAAELAAM